MNEILFKLKKSYLKYLFLFYFLLSYANVWCQFCTSDNRFTEVEYFTSAEISSNVNITYATNVIDWQGNSQDLDMDVYYPSAAAETLSERPFVLLIHGGGFQNGDKTKMHDDCVWFAKRGFVAATINYRLGWDPSQPNSKFEAVYRAQQDANAALRFIVDKANLGSIDTSWMFIGGRSAGAGTSLNIVYVDQQDWNIKVPGIETTLGSLDTSGNNLTHSFTLKGILNVKGGTIGIAIEPSEMLPTIAFHGLLDTTSPIDSSSLTGLVGSGYIHNLLKLNNVCTELTIDSIGGHDISTNSTGPGFRIDRASCFFKSIFCDNCATSYLTDPIDASCSTVSQLSDLEVANNMMKLYSNPAQNLFTITGDIALYEIKIFDSTGRILQIVNNASTPYTFDISTFPQGMYFIRITNLANNKLEIQKIIKE